MKSTTRLTLAVIAAILLAIPSFGQNYRLSSHILDIDAGVPASGVKITLEKMNPDGTWSFVDQKTTDENGRVKDFLEKGTDDSDGIYRLTYHVKPYFERKGIKTFYPFIEVAFEISGDKHYHVPITLSPFGYSTYRGN